MISRINKIIKDALINNNVLTEAQVAQYLSQAQTSGKTLYDLLTEKRVVTEKQIQIALSQSLNLDTIDLKNTSIDAAVLSRIPVKIAFYYKFMPVKIEKTILTIASALPIDLKVQDEIRMHLGLEVDVVLSTKTDAAESLKKYYGLASDTIDRIMSKDTKRTPTDNIDAIEDLEKESEDPTVTNLVNEIILEAFNKRATDIHIEPYRNKVRFRYRIDGVLVDANLPGDVKHFLSPILTRLKVMANLSITEKRLPQDGSAVVKIKEQQLDLRLSTLPTPRGESMVIRILPSKVMQFSLEKLGFDQASIRQIRSLIQKPHGIIFITGPTGSGKTTTLYACLNNINSSERKIITIEDPVEYEMEGITQIQVNPKVSFTFATGLRSVLRHDPDIIMVGEVRDLETAEIAIRTALTGHLVFSTLHTNDASSGITRLIDMGVEPYLVASSVEAFVAQRLVRVICPECKEQVKTPMVTIKEEIIHSLNLRKDEDIKIYQGKGCERCNHTGFYGRIAIYEILVLNDTVRGAILDKPRSDHIKKVAVREGLVTLRQNGWRAVLDGITTPSEVMNVSVKDELESPIEDSLDIPETESQESTRSFKDTRAERLKRKDIFNTDEEVNARIYPRVFARLDVRYRLVEQDPNDPNSLITDGIEYPTISEDISAGGLRFISKRLVSIGSLLEIKIQLEKGHKSLECLAKVCRVEEDSRENVFKIVTYYMDISSTERAAISKFILGKTHISENKNVPIHNQLAQ